MEEIAQSIAESVPALLAFVLLVSVFIGYIKSRDKIVETAAEATRVAADAREKRAEGRENKFAALMGEISSRLEVSEQRSRESEKRSLEMAASSTAVNKQTLEAMDKFLSLVDQWKKGTGQRST